MASPDSSKLGERGGTEALSLAPPPAFVAPAHISRQRGSGFSSSELGLRVLTIVSQDLKRDTGGVISQCR